MRAAILLLFARSLFGLELPAGSVLEIRLTTPVSTAGSQMGELVEAVVIAPALVGGRVAIPPGAIIDGAVTKIVPPTPSTAAVLSLRFNRLTIGGRVSHLATRVAAIDNAREHVDDAGTVRGIDPKDALTHRMDQGLDKLANTSLHGLASVLASAKGLFLDDADPNIRYAAGTELSLRLLKPIALSPDATPYAPPPPVPDNGHLSQLVNDQAAQTVAVHPQRASDITNLMLIGELSDIRQAFADAGWSGTDNLTAGAKWETARAIIEQRGMKEAPVSTILLNHRAPDWVFQKVNNTFSARHHIRIWHSLDTYQGRPVWLAAATHDIGIDFSQTEKTFIHKIETNIDLERAKVVDDLLFTGKAHALTLVPRNTVPLQFHNATGDAVSTDGRMAVLTF